MTIAERLEELAQRATWRVQIAAACDIVGHAAEALPGDEKGNDYYARGQIILETAYNWKSGCDIGPALLAAEGASPYHHHPDQPLSASWYFYLSAQQLAWILDPKTVNDSRLPAAAKSARDSVSRAGKPSYGDRSTWFSEELWQLRHLEQLVGSTSERADGRLRISLLAS